MLLKRVHGKIQICQHKTIAPQPARCIPHHRLRGMLHRFGNQFAAALSAPILRRAAGKIHLHHAFFALFAQAQTALVVAQVNGVFRLPDGGGVGEVGGEGESGNDG